MAACCRRAVHGGDSSQATDDGPDAAHWFVPAGCFGSVGHGIWPGERSATLITKPQMEVGESDGLRLCAPLHAHDANFATAETRTVWFFPFQMDWPIARFLACECCVLARRRGVRLAMRYS